MLGKNHPATNAVQDKRIGAIGARLDVQGCCLRGRRLG